MPTTPSSHYRAAAQHARRSIGTLITNVKLSGGRRTSIGEMLDHYEQSGFRTPADHDAILAKYGITRSDVVLWDYDIYLDVAAIPAGAQP